MHHLGTVEIETERLYLRRFCPDDALSMFNHWASDEKVTKFLRWPAHESIHITERVLQGWLADYAKPDFYQWAIVPKKLGEPIGSISAVGLDERLDMVHIGYCIGSRWWHRGITSEAFAAVIRFFFCQVGANRIESQHDPNNPHSGDVMKKCGLTYEGTHRQADFNQQGIVDAAVYAILASDYNRIG